MTPVRLLPRWARVLLLVVLPLAELVVFVAVAGALGTGWTVLLLLATSLLGIVLVRREGARAWRSLTTTLREGGLPTAELTDAFLVLLGGALLLLPGFVSDVLGLLLVLPGSRPLVRRVLVAVAGRRLLVARSGNPRDARRPGPGTAGPVVRGEVMDP